MAIMNIFQVPKFAGDVSESSYGNWSMRHNAKLSRASVRHDVYASGLIAITYSKCFALFNHSSCGMSRGNEVFVWRS